MPTPEYPCLLDLIYIIYLQSNQTLNLELSLGLGHLNITRVDTEPNNKGKLHKVINNFVFTSKRNRKKVMEYWENGIYPSSERL